MKIKTLIIVVGILFTVSLTAQTKTNYSTEGYRVGCELASTNNVNLYNATVGNSNFPQKYLDAVRFGWMNCPKPKKEGALGKETYKEIISRLKLYGSRLYSVIFVGGSTQ